MAANVGNGHQKLCNSGSQNKKGQSLEKRDQDHRKTHHFEGATKSLRSNPFGSKVETSLKKLSTGSGYSSMRIPVAVPPSTALYCSESAATAMASASGTEPAGKTRKSGQTLGNCRIRTRFAHE